MISICAIKTAALFFFFLLLLQYFIIYYLQFHHIQALGLAGPVPHVPWAGTFPVKGAGAVHALEGAAFHALMEVEILALGNTLL